MDKEKLLIYIFLALSKFISMFCVWLFALRFSHIYSFISALKIALRSTLVFATLGVVVVFILMLIFIFSGIIPLPMFTLQGKDLILWLAILFVSYVFIGFVLDYFLLRTNRQTIGNSGLWLLLANSCGAGLWIMLTQLFFEKFK